METSDHQAAAAAAAMEQQQQQQQGGMAGNAGVGIDDDRGGTSSSSMQQESGNRCLPVMLHVGGALILTWIASACSANSIFIVVIVFIYLYQVEKQARYREYRQIRHEERRKAHMARPDDGETVRWLNQAITSIWPACLESFASQQFLMPLVPWFLAKYKPKFVREILLQKLHLGNRAPVFTLIQGSDQQIEGDHLIIEAAMEFASGEDMSAEMSVVLRGLRANFYISKLHIEGKVKVAVKFVNRWPVIGRIRFCFVHSPNVEMVARPLSKGGIDVNNIPGAAKWLKETIQTVLEQSLVEPNLLVVDMEKIANYAMISNMTPEQTTALAQDDKGPVIAILHLEILDAKQLRTADRNDPFVTITLGASEMKTTAKKKSLNPTWKEKFHLPIYSWDCANILILQVLDSSCTVRVSDYKDGELHEENVHLEMKVKRQMKKVGQLRIAILVEKIALSEENQSNIAASQQQGTQELDMDKNTATTDFSTASSDNALSERLKIQIPLAPTNGNAHGGNQRRDTKDQSSHSRSNSSGGASETTQSLVLEAAQAPPPPPAREGKWSEIIDVAIGPPGAFVILHQPPRKVSPRNGLRGNERRANLAAEKAKTERGGGRKPVQKNWFHRRKRSAGGGSQESLPAMEKERDSSVVSSVENSGELLPPPPSPPLDYSGTVKFILEEVDAGAAASTITPDEEPNPQPPSSSSSKMFYHHPHALTPILSSQKQADPDDEDDDTRPHNLTSNGPDCTADDDLDHTNTNNNNNNSELRNGLPSAKRKKGGWFGNVRKMHIWRKKVKASQPLDNDDENHHQITYSQELYSGGDSESNYNSTYIIHKDDELPIHPDEKKIINSANSRRGSSLRNVSQRMLVRLGLGPKKPS